MPRPRIPDDEDWREQRPGESRAEYLSRYQKAYHNNVWYPAHRMERKQQVNERRRALFDWYHSYKATQKCARCPEWRPECLQFHHVDSKLKAFDVSQAMRRGISIERLKEEIGKCVILCANCHAVEEQNRRKKWFF